MPIIPPIAVKMIDEKDSRVPPHKTGTKPPRLDPIIMPIQIIDFDSIFIL
jgi:hypothetical protein